MASKLCAIILDHPNVFKISLIELFCALVLKSIYAPEFTIGFQNPYSCYNACSAFNNRCQGKCFHLKVQHSISQSAKYQMFIRNFFPTFIFYLFETLSLAQIFMLSKFYQFSHRKPFESHQSVEFDLPGFASEPTNVGNLCGDSVM